MTGGPDTYHGYGIGWANASNTPFREYKHWVHEGISSPLVAHWPAGIGKDRHGKLEHQPGHLIDIMALHGAFPEQSIHKKLVAQKSFPCRESHLPPVFRERTLNVKSLFLGTRRK